MNKEMPQRYRDSRIGTYTTKNDIARALEMLINAEQYLFEQRDNHAAYLIQAVRLWHRHTPDPWPTRYDAIAVVS